MAFRKITEGDMLGKGNVGRPDTPGVSTAEMQRIMDELPREVLAPAFNELAGQLEAETAAADIGAAAPEGVTAAPAGKLQAVLNGLRDLVKAHTDRADNPHGVTAAQAGAYSKAETDAAISAKVVELGAGDMAKSIYDPGNEQQPLLPRNGDGSNVTASFTEAEQDADIQTRTATAWWTGRQRRTGWLKSSSSKTTPGSRWLNLTGRPTGRYSLRPARWGPSPPSRKTTPSTRTLVQRRAPCARATTAGFPMHGGPAIYQ